MSDNDPLDRFVSAQAATYAGAFQEIVQGRKVSHWMWFIFPQLVGLGSSAMSQRYAIASIKEAQEYLDHPVLGARLRACLQALHNLPGENATKVFGNVDAMKLRSSLTLFLRAGGGAIFEAALQKFFDGRPDPLTDALLGLSDGGLN